MGADASKCIYDIHSHIGLALRILKWETDDGFQYDGIDIHFRIPDRCNTSCTVPYKNFTP